MTEKTNAKGRGRAAKKADDKQPQGAAVAEAGNLPLFYQQPVPLSVEKHKDTGLVGEANYDFAAETNSIPLNAIEFSMVQKFYPIVFTDQDPPMPVAVVGLRDKSNLYVDAKGKWEEGTYIPAYVRRYPFIFMTGPDRLQYVLCVDEASKLLTDKGERKLFADGKASELTENALKFCTTYQAQFEFSREFGEALAEKNLLVPNRADVKLNTGERIGLGGFRVVDEAKFNALPDEVFLEWRQKGWLHLVYSHLMSITNWNNLVNRAAETKAA